MEITAMKVLHLELCSVLHQMISKACMSQLNNICYCFRQIPLVIFKREKELARKLEFDGLYITEQPEDDDIKGQWDRLVLNTPYVDKEIIDFMLDGFFCQD